MLCAMSDDGLTVQRRLDPFGPAAAIVLSDDEVAALGGGKRAAVRVTIDGRSARLRLAVMGGQNVIGLSKAARSELGVETGAEVTAQIALDEAPREVEVPEELAAALAALVADHHGARSTAANPSVASWARTWCEGREADGVRGAAREKSVARARIDGTDLGAMLVRDVGRGDVVAWLAAVRASHATVSAKGARGARVEGTHVLSRQTVSHALHVLRGALHAARDRGLIAHDPTDGVKVARQARETEPWTWLSAAEVAAVAAFLASDDAAFMTGQTISVSGGLTMHG